MNSDFNLLSEIDTERSVTWNEKPLRQSHLSTLWKRGSCIRLLCGLTLPPSTAQRGVDRWISSLRDSRASQPVSQGEGQEQATRAGSGLMFGGSCRKRSHRTCSSRTCAASSQLTMVEPLKKSSGTWPKAGTMRNGVYTVHQMQVRHTVGSGSSSWPTHTANPATYSNGQRGQNLIETAEHWQTPAPFQGKYHRQVGQTERGEMLLPGQSETWATPTTRDSKDGSNPSDNVPTNGLLGRQAPRTLMPGRKSSPTDQASPRRLNPKFVEWLMGWPGGYLDPSDYAFSVMA